MLCNQSGSVVGESSKPLMESTVISVMPKALTASISPISNSDQASKLLASNPTRVLGVLDVGKALASRSCSTAVVLDSVKAGSSIGLVSNAEVTHGLGNRNFGSTNDMVVSLAIEASILKVVSPILGRYPWVVQNRFSPLSDLGNRVEDEFM